MRLEEAVLHGDRFGGTMIDPCSEKYTEELITLKCRILRGMREWMCINGCGPMADAHDNSGAWHCATCHFTHMDTDPAPLDRIHDIAVGILKAA